MADEENDEPKKRGGLVKIIAMVVKENKVNLKLAEKLT